MQEMSLQPLSNLDILHCIYNDVNIRSIFGGLYYRNTIPHDKYYEKTTLLICNTSKDSEPGMHWVAFLVGVKPIVYFDSMGKRPNKAFHKLLGDHYVYSNLQLQDKNQPTCGYYVLHFAAKSAMGTSFETIIRDLYLLDDRTISSWPLARLNRP